MCEGDKPHTEFYSGHRRCKACCIARTKKWKADRPDYNRVKHARDPRVAMLSQAKVRAKRKGLPFDITRDDLTVPARCPVLGIPLAVSTDGNPSDGSPSLDRLIPEEGYIRGNVIIVSNKANRIKSDASLDDLRAVVDFYELLLPETKRHRKDPA